MSVATPDTFRFSSFQVLERLTYDTQKIIGKYTLFILLERGDFFFIESGACSSERRGLFAISLPVIPGSFHV